MHADDGDASCVWWIRRALALVVISCPCSLIVAVPLTNACAISALANWGILVKSPTQLELLAHALAGTPLDAPPRRSLCLGLVSAIALVPLSSLDAMEKVKYASVASVVLVYTFVGCVCAAGALRLLESRQAYDVDVRKLKAIGGGLYTLPGGLSRPPAERVDVAKLGRIDAEFVSDRDAYLVDESELRFTAPKTDVDALAEGLAEYTELKARLLIEAAIVGAAISAALLPTLGSEIAATFFAGVGAGVAYLLLLESESDALGADGFGELGDRVQRADALGAEGFVAL